MTDTVLQSFCERCGTRYTFSEPEPPAGEASTTKRGLFGRRTTSEPADTDEPTVATAPPSSERFAGTFHFCLDCRQYTCTTCWNPEAGACLGCRPPQRAGESVTGDAARVSPFASGGGAESWPSGDFSQSDATTAGSAAASGELDEWGRPRVSAEEPEPSPEEAPSEPVPKLDPWRGVVFSDKEKDAGAEPPAPSLNLSSRLADASTSETWPQADAQSPPSPPAPEDATAWPEVDRKGEEMPVSEPEAVVEAAPAVEPEAVAEMPRPDAPVAEVVVVNDDPGVDGPVSEEPPDAEVTPEAARPPVLQPSSGRSAWVRSSATLGGAATSPEPEPEPEPPAPVDDSDAISRSETEAAPESEIDSEPVAESEPESESEPDVEPKSGRAAELETEPVPASERVVETEPDPDDALKSEPLTEPEPESEPALEAEPEADAEPQAGAVPRSVVEPEPEPQIEEVPSSEPVVSAAAVAQPVVTSDGPAPQTPAEVLPEPSPQLPAETETVTPPPPGPAVVSGEVPVTPTDPAPAPQPAPPLSPPAIGPIDPANVPPRPEVWPTASESGPFQQPYQAPTSGQPVAEPTPPTTTAPPSTLPTEPATPSPQAPPPMPPPPAAPPPRAQPSVAYAPPPAQPVVPPQPTAVPQPAPPVALPPAQPAYAPPPSAAPPPAPPPARPLPQAPLGSKIHACTNCGLQLSAKARFCRRCGTPQA